MSDFDLHPEIAKLVDAWCERRALQPLRILLPVWPPPMLLTEHAADLLGALRHIRAMCKETLPPQELETVAKAIACLQVMLHGR
jgi:hypothetical protein